MAQASPANPFPHAATVVVNGAVRSNWKTPSGKATRTSRLIANIAGSLAGVEREESSTLSVAHFRQADPEYGARLEAAVKERRRR